MGQRPKLQHEGLDTASEYGIRVLLLPGGRDGTLEHVPGMVVGIIVLGKHVHPEEIAMTQEAQAPTNGTYIPEKKRLQRDVILIVGFYRLKTGG